MKVTPRFYLLLWTSMPSLEDLHACFRISNWIVSGHKYCCHQYWEQYDPFYMRFLVFHYFELLVWTLAARKKFMRCYTGFRLQSCVGWNSWRDSPVDCRLIGRGWRCGQEQCKANSCPFHITVDAVAACIQDGEGEAWAQVISEAWGVDKQSISMSVYTCCLPHRLAIWLRWKGSWMALFDQNKESLKVGSVLSQPMIFEWIEANLGTLKRNVLWWSSKKRWLTWALKCW